MVANWPQPNSLFRPPTLRPGGSFQPPAPAPFPGTPPQFGGNQSFAPSLPGLPDFNIPQAPIGLPAPTYAPSQSPFAAPSTGGNPWAQGPAQAPAQAQFGFAPAPAQPQQPSQQVDLAALMTALRPSGAQQDRQYFANSIQGGIDQIGSIVQGNVSRLAAKREFENQLRLTKLFADNQHTERMAAISGRDRMLEGLLGSLRGGGSVPQPQQPGLSDAAQIQDQSAGSLYDDLLSQAAPAAMAESRLGGFGFSDPNGRFGSATLPGAGGGGIGELGINTSPGQIWNAQDAQDARSRLGSVVNATVPHLAGSGDGPIRSGLQNTFSDLLRGAAAKTFGGLERAGTQADASQTLNANMTNSQLQNVLWRLMGQMYATNLGGDAQDNLLRSRALSALA